MPYVEVYYTNVDGESVWAYLCRWHFYLEWYIRRRKGGYCYVDKEYRKIAKLIDKYCKRTLKEWKKWNKEYKVETELNEEDAMRDLYEWIMYYIFDKEINIE